MKKQIITLQKESILSDSDMTLDIQQRMSTYEFHIIQHINKLLSTPTSDWDSDENKMTITRIWEDEDYDDYAANFSNFKTKLKSDGYQITELISDFKA
jgi:hypothetical protein